MTTRTTHPKTVGILVTAVAAAALLVPNALARPDSWQPLTQSLTSTSTTYPDAFERAALRSGAELGGIESYPDSGRTGFSSTAAYPDAFERAVNRATAQTPGSGGDSIDWSLVGTFSALGALCAVLAAGTLATMRQRARLA